MKMSGEFVKQDDNGYLVRTNPNTYRGVMTKDGQSFTKTIRSTSVEDAIAMWDRWRGAAVEIKIDRTTAPDRPSRNETKPITPKQKASGNRIAEKASIKTKKIVRVQNVFCPLIEDACRRDCVFHRNQETHCKLSDLADIVSSIRNATLI